MALAEAKSAALRYDWFGSDLEPGMLTDIEAFKKALAEWWTGKVTPHRNDPGSNVVRFGTVTRRHWTSSLVHLVVDPILRRRSH